MINRTLQEGRARVKSKKLKKWGRSGRKEGGEERFCPGLKHWSVRIHSHSAALSSLDKLPSASETQGWVCASGSHVFYGWLTVDWLHVRTGKRKRPRYAVWKEQIGVTPECFRNNPVLPMQHTFSVTHSCITLLPSLMCTLQRFRWSSWNCNRIFATGSAIDKTTWDLNLLRWMDSSSLLVFLRNIVLMLFKEDSSCMSISKES